MSDQELTRLTGPPRLAKAPELFHSFQQDARFGIRLLLKQPVALLSALAALALGIGLVTFMFCMVNGSLLRTLPLPGPDRVVYTTIPVGLLHEFSEQQTTFDGLAAFGAFPGNFRVAQKSERLSVCFVTDNLIISQVAVSVTILVAAFALLENTRRLHDFHLSFDPGTVMTLAVEVPRSADTNRFFVEMQDDLARIPGVKAVALASDGFAFGHGVTAIELPGQSYVHPEERPRVSARTVTANYFEAASLRFVAGRGFNSEDRAGAPLVAVVNASFSKRFFPAGSALGQCFREGSGPWLTIVGCIPDALTYGDGEREAVCYVPLAQHPRPTMNVLVRGNGNASQWLKPVVAEVARLQPDLPAPRPESVQEELDGVSRGARGASVLLTLCGTASLFLAGIGIFGLLSLSVGQRRREIGLRLALGATRGSVLWTILKQATTQIAIGLTVGVCLAWGLVRTIASLLPSTVSEPGVYLAVLVVLGGVSLVAVFVPARRASRADPMQALRYE